MEPSKLQLNCSPKTFRLIQTNPQYQAEVVNQLAKSQDSFVEEIIFSENPIDPNSNCSVEEMDAEQKKNEGLSAPTKLLKSLVKEIRPQVGKTVKLKTKKKMWQVISEKMYENGYFYNAQQVEGKYYSLERQYKRHKIHNSLTGRSRQTFLYKDELDDLLQERKCINPEYLLDEESAVSTPEDETSQDENLPSTSKGSIANSKGKTPNKKKSLQEQFLEKLDTLTEKTKEFEEKSLEILKNIAEKAKRKEERAQREEERKKRKMELLETIVAKLNEK